MKYLLRVLVFVGISLTLIACGSAITATPSPTLSPTGAITETPTPSPFPSLTATSMLVPTATQGYVYPTLVPTIDPTLVPALLGDAISIQEFKSVNGHPIRQVTGWDYGYGGEDWYANRCPGYIWLDTNHLLLFPRSGQGLASIQGWDRAVNLVPQAVVIDLESQAAWLPPETSATSPGTCSNGVLFSPEVGVLITSRTENEIPVVTTYHIDGRKIADYRGHIWDISPSRTKILLERDLLLDLRSNTRIKLSWPTLEGEDVAFYTDYYWSYPDETRVYHCCSYYADLDSGKSFRFRITDDFKFGEVQTMDETSPYFNGLPYMNGQWVRDNTYFLIEWSWVDDGDIRYLPMFDPSKKIIFDLREKAGISRDWSCQQTMISPDGMYVWMTGWGEKEEGSYLVNLNTFESHYFPGKEYLHIDWSPNSEYAWLYRSDGTGDPEEYSILSVADMEIKPLSAKPLSNSSYWNPSGDTVVYPRDGNKAMIFMNVASMTYKELQFPLPERIESSQFVWSPNGARFILTAEDGSLWQVDTPTLENLEQLTKPMPEVRDVSWSPDGNSISFVSGQDIYIVDAAK